MTLTWEEYWYVRVLAVLVVYQIQASQGEKASVGSVSNEHQPPRTTALKPRNPESFCTYYGHECKCLEKKKVNEKIFYSIMNCPECDEAEIEKATIAELQEWKRKAEIRDIDALRSYGRLVKEKARLEDEVVKLTIQLKITQENRKKDHLKKSNHEIGCELEYIAQVLDFRQENKFGEILRQIASRIK
jgi:hypothetical protein